MIKEGVEYPIKRILTDIAQTHKVPLRYFRGTHFLPGTQGDHFPFLANLSYHVQFSSKVGIEIKKDEMVAFEGFNKGLSIAYFGKRVKKFSNFNREHGLVYSHGRRIHLTLNENGNGKIRLEDIRAEEAKSELGADSFGSSEGKPRGRYGFRQKGDSTLPGVKEFLNTIIG